MVYEEIEFSVSAAVANIVLNRPARRNAYTPDMGEELVHALRSAINDDEVRVVLLTGAGLGFCAGAERGKCGLRLGEESLINAFTVELSQSPKPLIAAINGVAVGIGVTMVLPFDIRIAASSATFGFPFTQLGMVPGLGATQIMQRLVGYAKATEIVFCGRTLDAHEALAIGLVNKVVPPEELLTVAHEVAAKILESPAASIAAARRSFAFAAHSSLGAAVANEHKENEGLRETRESIAEGRSASHTDSKKSGTELN
jgi:enoyl-CoA hydratase/carnithine racemase